MTLLSKLEKLEKAASRKTAKPIEVDPELVAFAGQLLREMAEREQRETVSEKAARLREDIAELREKIEHYQVPADPLVALL